MWCSDKYATVTWLPDGKQIVLVNGYAGGSAGSRLHYGEWQDGYKNSVGMWVKAGSKQRWVFRDVDRDRGDRYWGDGARWKIE